jgi:hypothetical protein
MRVHKTQSRWLGDGDEHNKERIRSWEAEVSLSTALMRMVRGCWKQQNWLGRCVTRWGTMFILERAVGCNMIMRHLTVGVWHYSTLQKG